MAMAYWNGPALTYVRYCFAVRTAATSSGVPVTQPTFQPVNEKLLPQLAELGPGKIIGISCYERLEHAVEAERQGADYVAFGAFFASVTKPDAVAAPADLLHHAKQKLRIPIVAIGGIIPENAGELIRQGADAVAVSDALFNARHIRSVAEKFSLLFRSNQHFIPHNHGLTNNVT